MGAWQCVFGCGTGTWLLQSREDHIALRPRSSGEALTWVLLPTDPSVQPLTGVLEETCFNGTEER